MFAPFILELRRAGVPSSLTEWLSLLGAMRAGVADYSVEDFYFLARAALVKDERYLDRFDRVFSQVFKGLEPPEGEETPLLPEEWLRKIAEKNLTPEEMAQIEAMGGFEKLVLARAVRLVLEERVFLHGRRTVVFE